MSQSDTSSTKGGAVSWEEYAALKEEKEALQRRLSKLESRMDSVENKVDHAVKSRETDEDDSGISFGDWRDQRVVEELSEGDWITEAFLFRKYEKTVGMTNNERIANRVERLLQSNLFMTPSDPDEAPDYADYRFAGVA